MPHNEAAGDAAAGEGGAGIDWEWVPLLSLGAKELALADWPSQECVRTSDQRPNVGETAKPEIQFEVVQMPNATATTTATTLATNQASGAFPSAIIPCFDCGK